MSTDAATNLTVGCLMSRLQMWMPPSIWLAAMVEHCVKRPFDVPGVGRNALLRDPAGALVGVSSSCHGFPPPTAQFGVERYVTQDGTFPDTFYNALFDWTKKQDGDIYRANTCIAACASHTSSAPKLARWVPSLRIHHLATDLKQMDTTGSTLMRDATGAAVYLVKA
ncbi:MAG: hypothetical protein AAFW87_08145 [Pseudomonadota bacterium]